MAWEDVMVSDEDGAGTAQGQAGIVAYLRGMSCEISSISGETNRRIGALARKGLGLDRREDLPAALDAEDGLAGTRDGEVGDVTGLVV